MEKTKKNKGRNKEYIELEEPLHLIVIEEGKNLELLKMLEKKFGKNAKMEDIINYYKDKFNISGKVILY